MSTEHNKQGVQNQTNETTGYIQANQRHIDTFSEPGVDGEKDDYFMRVVQNDKEVAPKLNQSENHIVRDDGD